MWRRVNLNVHMHLPVVIFHETPKMFAMHQILYILIHGNVISRCCTLNFLEIFCHVNRYSSGRPSISGWETLSAFWAILQSLGTFRRVVPTDRTKHVLDTLDMHFAAALLTVSKACVYEDATDAAAGAKGSLGALFWMSSAIWAILRKEEEDPSGPNDTAWKDNALLDCTSKSGDPTRKTGHEPKTNRGAAQILNSLICDMALAIRQEYHYRGSENIV